MEALFLVRCVIVLVARMSTNLEAQPFMSFISFEQTINTAGGKTGEEQCLKLMVTQSPLAAKNWAGPVKFDRGQVKNVID